MSDVWSPPVNEHNPVKELNSVEPVTQSSRIGSIDVLRGFALLGILVMNIQSFGLISAMYMNPTAQGPMEPTDNIIWWLGFLFFDTKMMSIFSMLFGAGIVLMWEKSKAAGRSFTGKHYMRMAILLVFGLLHAYLIWEGDILVCYAITGMVVYWLCGLNWRWLVAIGIVFFMVRLSISAGLGTLMSMQSAETIAEFRNDWVPSQAKIDEEIATRQGPFLGNLIFRSFLASMMQLFLLPMFFFWRAGGLMLIGMALFKTGILSAQKSKSFYIKGMVAGFAIGLPMVYFSQFQHESHNWEAINSMFFASLWNIAGSPFVSFAYICAIMLFCKSNAMLWIKSSLAAVGQMALTNYLMHSIICTLIFYGHGFGLFATLNRAQLLCIVFSIWTVQLIASPIWLKYAKFGPFEWLWRSASYLKLQPLFR